MATEPQANQTTGVTVGYMPRAIWDYGLNDQGSVLAIDMTITKSDGDKIPLVVMTGHLNYKDMPHETMRDMYKAGKPAEEIIKKVEADETANDRFKQFQATYRYAAGKRRENSLTAF